MINKRKGAYGFFSTSNGESGAIRRIEKTTMNFSVRNLLTWAAIGILHCWVISLVTNSATFNRFLPILNPFPTFSSPASTTSHATDAGSTSFRDALRARRTYYALNKTLPVAQDRIADIVEDAVQAVPSAFNSQTNRAVVLLGAEHSRLWDVVVADVLRTHVDAEQWEATSRKLAGFAAAAGTVRRTILTIHTSPPSPPNGFASWVANRIAADPPLHGRGRS